jgi:hypothetical protein
MKIKFSTEIEGGPFYTQGTFPQINGTVSYYSDIDGMSYKIAEILGISVDTYISTIDRDSAFAMMDNYSSDCGEVVEAFYDEYDDFKDIIIDSDSFIEPNMLYIKSCLVFKEFRGLSIGRILFDRLMMVFGRSYGIVSLKPFPLQYSTGYDSYDFSDLTLNEDKANKKIKSICKKWGLNNLRGTPFYYLNVKKYFENEISFTKSFNNKDMDSRLDKFKKRLEID